MVVFPPLLKNTEAEASEAVPIWRRRRWRRRRCNGSGLAFLVPLFWGSFYSTFPKTSTSLLAPKSPPPSPASVVVCSSSILYIQFYMHAFCSTSTSLFAVAEGYWLKQSSLSPYAGFHFTFFLFLFRFVDSVDYCYCFVVCSRISGSCSCCQDQCTMVPLCYWRFSARSQLEGTCCQLYHFLFRCLISMEPHADFEIPML